MAQVITISEGDAKFGVGDYVINPKENYKAIYLVTKIDLRGSDILDDRFDGVVIYTNGKYNQKKVGHISVNMWQGAFQKFFGEINIISY